MGHEVFLFFVWEGTKDIWGTRELFLLDGVIGKQDQIRTEYTFDINSKLMAKRLPA